MEANLAVRMVNITKTFSHVVANNNITLEIHRGEILSLLGENGSGKTTLMNMLSGIYFPDSGQIYVNGEEVSIASPKDALDLHIGMIHQHFKLVDVFTAAENIILGLNEKAVLDLNGVRRAVKEICDRYGFVIDPDKKVYDMSVSEKQTLEIVKVLYRGADILILDEPTALHEVMEISDRVAVLRKGEYIGEVPTSQTNPQQLTDMMVGKATTLNIDRPEPNGLTERLIVKNLTVKDADGVKKLSNVSFTAYGGEILGIAGISGSGQRELLEAIAGLQDPEEGSSIMFIPPDKEASELVGRDPEDIYKSGVGLAFVPEDRFGMGLVGSMDLVDNIMLRSYKSGKSPIADRKHPRERENKIVEELEVVTPNLGTPLRRLSGGNVQKILVGREIAAEPSLLMTAYAVRGLDINTSYTIYHLLNEQKAKGAAVIYVGEDLDVLLELCDRIVVLCAGRVSGIVNGRSARKEEVGLLMTRLSGKENANE